MISPSTDHFTYFIQWNCQGRVLFVIKTFYLPCDLHEEFKQIKFCGSSNNEGILLVRRSVASEQ